jgi:hypothetical protein
MPVRRRPGYGSTPGGATSSLPDTPRTGDLTLSRPDLFRLCAPEPSFRAAGLRLVTRFLPTTQPLRRAADPRARASLGAWRQDQCGSEAVLSVRTTLGRSLRQLLFAAPFPAGSDQAVRVLATNAFYLAGNFSRGSSATR